MYSLQLVKQYGLVDQRRLSVEFKDSLFLVKRLELSSRLKFHNGCVNTVVWSRDGRELLSGSDDRQLIISDPFTKKACFTVKTHHQSNIFSAKFLPVSGEYRLVSCAGSGSVQYTELTPTGDYTGHLFNCHNTLVYQVQVNPADHNEFITCEEGGNVRVFDLRTKNSCNCTGCDKDVVYKYSSAVTSMAVNPLRPFYLAHGLSNGMINIVDRRMPQQEGLGVAQFKPTSVGERCRITALQFDQTGTEILSSYSEDWIYLFNFLNPDISPLDNNHQRCRHLCSTLGKGLLRDRERHVTSEQSEQILQHSHDSEGPVGESREARPIRRRLRLRGDWSDTGPDACPDNEHEDRPTGVMERLSSVLSRWMEDSLEPSSPSEEGQDTDRDSTPSPSDQRSDDGPIESPSDQRSDNLSLHDSDQESYLPSTPPPLDQRLDLPSTPPPSDQRSDLPSTPPPSDQRSDLPSTPPPSDQRSDLPSTPPPSDQRSDLPSTPPPLDQRSDLPSTPPPLDQRSDLPSTPPLSDPRSVDPSNSPPHPPVLPFHPMSKKPLADHQQPPCDTNVNNVESSPPELETSGLTSQSGAMGPQATCCDHKSHSSSNEHSCFQTDTDSGSQSKVKIFHIQSSPVPYSHYQNLEKNAKQKQARTSTNSDDSTYQSEPTHGNTPSESEQCGKPYLCYKGHRNARTVIKQCNFWGNNFVLSGSDCGRVFIWDKWTGKIVNAFVADRRVVNCVQPHPEAACLATSGIEYDIKLWEPTSSVPCNLENISRVTERNERMLRETRGTVTIPSASMLRFLAILFRRGMSQEQEQDQND